MEQNIFLSVFVVHIKYKIKEWIIYIYFFRINLYKSLDNVLIIESIKFTEKLVVFCDH